MTLSFSVRIQHWESIKLFPTILFQSLVFEIAFGGGQVGRDDIDLAHMALKQFYQGV